MNDLYLILHKVRGEPAFDIAQRMEVDGDDEPWWIIPTSGHRAYPLMWWRTVSLSSVDGYGLTDLSQAHHLAGFEALPDHYQTCAAPGKGRITDLLSVLGLRKPAKPFPRRF